MVRDSRNASRAKKFDHVPEISGLLDHRISMISVCGEDGDDVRHPFMIFGMGYSMDMGKEMGVMPVGCLCPGTVRVLYCCVL